MTSELHVVSAGYINRSDTCPSCGVLMGFMVDENEKVVTAFCTHYPCPSFLLEVKGGGDGEAD